MTEQQHPKHVGGQRFKNIIVNLMSNACICWLILRKFYNTILKIRHKFYIASEAAPTPPNEQFGVRARENRTLKLIEKT